MFTVYVIPAKPYPVENQELIFNRIGFRGNDVNINVKKFFLNNQLEYYCFDNFLKINHKARFFF
jgi:hypothetical protein